MRAMVLAAPGSSLELRDVPVPRPGPGQVLVKVRACGVCRTDLHILDGELCGIRSPVIPGHEIVGIATEVGSEVHTIHAGDRIGIPWLGHTCGTCRHCRSGRENLCSAAQFTGCTQDGGYAEYAVADARFCFLLPKGFSDTELAPWLCAGLIGYRTLRMAGDARRVGIYGFGAAAHIVAQLARHEGREVFVYTKPGDVAAQAFARELGAVWAGDSDVRAPAELDAALLFAPVGSLVPKALADVGKGGTVVCGGIHMSDIPQFSYDLLWGERQIRSVANLTRRDGEEFIELARRIPVRTTVVPFALERANEALETLRNGRLTGAAVLEMP
ncbi:MAG: zinc-dependent alcohol dehydrogenase family protein [Betaproteobacteria bacterium]|nr:zinc-dependent alcohol dehydrogenase family protein [Betaproteobacteria bacterium]